MKRDAKHTAPPLDLQKLRQQLQQAIRGGGSTVAQILEAVPVGIFVIDAAGKPFYVNKIAQNLLGKGIAPNAGPEQLAETYHAFLAGTSTAYPASRMPVVRALSGETAVVTDMEIHHPDRVIPLQVWGAPIVDDEGSVVFAIAAFSDISERRDAEQRLSSQYDVARALAESPSLAEAAPRILEAIGTITAWDHAALWRVDFSADLLRCVDVWQRPGHEARELMESTRRITYSRGEGLPGIVWEKGSHEWVVEGTGPMRYPRAAEAGAAGIRAGAAFPIMFGSRVLGVVEFLSQELRTSDARLVEMMAAHGSQIGQFIEREMAERALRSAKEEAEREARSKADFLAIMSHEIRTPMNAVTGMTGLLLETALTREQREYAQMAQNSAESLLSVINDVLDFSRVESGSLALDLHPFELNACLEEVFDLVAHQALLKNLDLISLIEPGVPDFIKGDSTRLRQVIVNLVNNAIKFTDSGQIVVTVRTVGHVEGGAELLEFTVEDTGIGIASDRVSQLFMPFSQGDTSTTRKHGGTGLGLAICKKLVEIMGGSISVHSTPGKGSRFTFAIQALRDPGVRKRHLEQNTPELVGKRALVVAGAGPSLRALTGHLRRWGMNPVGVPSCEAARTVVAEGRPFDIALIDAQDAEDEVLALASALQRAQGQGPARTILLSFFGAQEMTLERSPELFGAVISKPVKQTQLFDTVIEVISGKGAGRSLHAPRHLDPHLSQKLPLRILVAEDNAMNQKLMLLVLRQMGYAAEMAGNGREVLSMLAKQPYDLIFMDVEMPDMDGLEATRVIVRDWPGESRPVIVGTTAYGLAGDEHQCLEAGMNDCINKPIRIEQIQECLLRWGEPRLERGPSAKKRTAPASDVIDRERIAELEEMGARAKRNVIRDLVNVYLEDLPSMTEALRDALERGDTAATRTAAHRLKGTSLNVGANALAEICRAMEMKARAGESAGLQELLPDLLKRAREAEQALKGLLIERA